ncbi:MAG: cupin domain-containing protein [Candidatus Aminicenantes bacterium]
MHKISRESQPEVEVFEGVTRRTIACGKDVLMARFEYKKGSKVPPHKHYYEQVTTILKGEQKVVIRREGQEEELSLKEGDSYIVPANFEHEQISLTDAVTIDAWSTTP